VEPRKHLEAARQRPEGMPSCAYEPRHELKQIETLSAIVTECGTVVDERGEVINCEFIY
jgi:hypothetical protein